MSSNSLRKCSNRNNQARNSNKNYTKRKECFSDYKLWAESNSNHNNNSTVHERRKHAYSSTTNRSQFLHSSFKFVVLENEIDLSVYQSDSDNQIPWSLVRQVVCFTFQEDDLRCPICLSREFLAPRIARCGHILCLPCMLQVVHHSVAAPLCPVCFNNLSLKNILPMRIVPIWSSRVKAGDSVSLVLLRRGVDTSHIDLVESSISPFNNESNSFLTELLYNRIVSASCSYFLNFYLHEIDDLNIQKQHETSMGDSSDIDWIEKSIALVQLESESVIEDLFDEEEIGQHNQTKNSNQALDQIYFYQPMDGSLLFISPLDLKIIKYWRGSYDNFPSLLRCTIESISPSYIVDVDLRKRYKFLAHLPLGTFIQFMDCDWTKSKDTQLPDEILSHFHSLLQERSRKSKKKFRKEEHDRKRAERLRHEIFCTEMSQLGLDLAGTIDEENTICTSSDFYFPQLSQSDEKTGMGQQNIKFNANTDMPKWSEKLSNSKGSEKVQEDDKVEWTLDWDELCRDSMSSASHNSRKLKGKKLVLVSSGGRDYSNHQKSGES